MFSLIITLVSIALVAALAIATLYFGGDAMNKGDASARAAQVVVQGQQVLSAADLFFADKGRWPNSVDEMVAEKYLQQVPAFSIRAAAADAAVVPNAFAQATPATQALWTMPKPGKPTFTLENAVTPDICGQVNFKARGDNGILKQARTSLASQCFGDDTSKLVVVVTKEPKELDQALDPAQVKTDGVPTDKNSPDWLTAPGEALAGAGGAAGGTEGGTGPTQGAGIFTASRHAELTGAQMEVGYDEVLDEPIYGPDTRFIYEQVGNVVRVYPDPVLNRSGWDLMLITNKSSESATFDFRSDDNYVGGMNWYGGVGATVEEDRQLQIDEYGYQFCEADGTLAPNQGCLIELYVPKVCSSAYVTNQGPLSIVVVPQGCAIPGPSPELVSFDTTQYVYGDPNAIATARVKHLPADFYFQGGAELVSVTPMGNDISEVKFKITQSVWATDRYFTIEHDRGSLELGEVFTICGANMVKTGGSYPQCVPDYAGADGFFVEADPTGHFTAHAPNWSDWSSADSRMVPADHPSVIGAGTFANGDGTYTAFVHGKGSDSFSAKFLSGLTNNTLTLDTNLSTHYSKYCTSNYCYLLAADQAWRDGAPDNRAHYLYIYHSGGVVTGFSVYVEDSLGSYYPEPRHLQDGLRLTVKDNGVTLMEFSLRSDGTVLKPWYYGSFIPKEIKLGQGMFQGPTFNTPTY